MSRASLSRMSPVVFLLLTACGKAESGQAGGSRPQAPAAAHTAQAAVPSDPRAALFLQKGCPQCHTISALGIKSETEVGPDLTFAYTDVQSRFNMKLEEFLHHPTGTMQMVLSSQIQLSPAERDSVIHILKGLHEEAEKAEKAKGHE